MDDEPLLLACLASGCTATFVVAFWLHILNWGKQSNANVGGSATLEESDRRKQLRSIAFGYLLLESMINGLVSAGFFTGRESDEELQRIVEISGDSPLPFRAMEIRAYAFSLSAIVGSALFLGFLMLTSSYGGIESFVVGTLIAVVAAAGCNWAILRGIRQRAEAHTRRIVKRLPFALDLVAVALAGSGNVLQALETLLRNEPQRDALVDEFNRLLRQTRELGLTRALQSMKRRLAHPAVDQLVFALIQAEINGAELAEAFRTQAGRMLERRFQEGEKQSHEAGVKMVFPGMLIVVACFIITVIPFLFATVVQYSTSGGVTLE